MLPRLIQGGMGVGVSGWRLAREVASRGQLGVVSGTALDTILVRRLGLGDPGGHVRRAMAAFPVPEIAARALKRYFRPEPGARSPAAPVASVNGSAGAVNGAAASANGAAGHGNGAAIQARFHLLPLPRIRSRSEFDWLLVLANFVEVYLAREGHDGLVGINYLHKVQFPVLPSVYGAMLAGVDVVLMGAGIPGDIPGVLDRLAANEPASVRVDVLDAGDRTYTLSFDAAALWSGAAAGEPPPLARPRFLAIVSSVTLAKALLKKAPGGIDGFVVEAPIAGGHNAPPRGPQQLSVRGEPIYGVRDEVDLAQMRELGVPFWLAGGYASRPRFEAAIAAGARGVQVGTVFAFCEESGLDPGLRRRFLAGLVAGESDIFTDPLASPTNFPFKAAALPGTLSDLEVYAERPRRCDLGYLRRAYARSDGSIGYRCPGEPVDDYVAKGGKIEDTVGRKCLCNALMSNIGIGQVRADGYVEPALLTAGNDIDCVRPFITRERLAYHAAEVIEALVPSEGA